MEKIEVKFLGAEEVARDTLSFRFDLEDQEFEFLPGQYLILYLPELEKEPHTFSIASAPDEPFLMIATRMTDSAFKHGLAELEKGDTVNVEGPYGELVSDEEESVPMILLAGGIGTTPFRSMIKNGMEQQPERPITLLYSNHTPPDAPFLEELRQWARANEHFRLLSTMTRPEEFSGAWDGRTGRIDTAWLKEQAPEPWDKPLFYAAGPPDFVKGMKRLLKEADVPRKLIRAEEFTGY